MNINKLEIELRKILDDNEFTLNPKNYYSQIIGELEALIDNIRKLNDALSDIRCNKEYYSEIFNNRRKMLDYILQCEDVEYVIERRLKELKSSFNIFIYRMYKNQDLYNLLIDDFPNFELIVNKIMLIENKNDKWDSEIIDVIGHLRVWLENISFEEDDDDSIYALDKEFEHCYQCYYK